MKVIAYGAVLAAESTISLGAQLLEGTSHTVEWTALALFLITALPSARSFANALFDHINGETT